MGGRVKETRAQTDALTPFSSALKKPSSKNHLTRDKNVPVCAEAGQRDGRPEESSHEV